MSADRDTDELAALLKAEAATFDYPQTPDLAAAVSKRLLASSRPGTGRRRIARGALVALLLLAALLVVPEVRGAAIRLLQIGAVRVRLVPAPSAPPTAVPQATRSASPPPLPGQSPPPAAGQPRPPTPSPGLALALRGPTTLAEAAGRVAFPIHLPAYPEALGGPDLVYLQDLDGDALILIWLDPAAPERPLLSLHILTSAVFVQKTVLGDETERLAETRVRGSPALWVRGPHLLQVGRQGRGELEQVRIVDGNTLIWTDAELTYRLETRLPLEEALRIAESLEQTP